MKRVFEIGAYVLASAVALGGGFLGADALFGGDGAREATPAAERTATPPPDSAEVRNGRYGFSFRYPKEWGAGPRNHPSVLESVGRRDGVFCYVSVLGEKVASDETGKPKDLRRMMNGLTTKHLEKLPAAFGTVKVDTFEKSTLGGQDARFFVITANPQGQELKLRGHATLRNYGAVFLMCVSPGDRFQERDVQAAFRLAHQTFAFEQRPH
jgi:hypothetical protein